MIPSAICEHEQGKLPVHFRDFHNPRTLTLMVSCQD